MRIVTWNINSLRLRIPHLARMADALAPDIVCLQETKVPDDAFPADRLAEIGFPHALYRGMKSYNGVAILSAAPLREIHRRDWCGREDCRHIAAALPGGAELHNFYVPAGGDIPDPEQNEKFAHKLEFVAQMTDWFATLKKGRRILVGDLNIAPLETDVWSHKALLKVVSHTPIEVAALDNLARSRDWVDAVRRFIPPDEPLYSWWSYRAHDWSAADKGRRLDHVWVTPDLAPTLLNAEVARDVRGWNKPSDHAPVIVELDV